MFTRTAEIDDRLETELACEQADVVVSEAVQAVAAEEEPGASPSRRRRQAAEITRVMRAVEREPHCPAGGILARVLSHPGTATSDAAKSNDSSFAIRAPPTMGFIFARVIGGEHPGQRLRRSCSRGRDDLLLPGWPRGAVGSSSHHRGEDVARAKRSSLPAARAAARAGQLEVFNVAR